MNWSDINVFQFQQVAKHIEEPDNLEREGKLISALSGLTVHEVEMLPLDQYRKWKQDIQFINNEIKGESAKYIDVNGKRYKCIYNVFELNAARYIETKVFAANVVDNLHLIAASMVVPMRKTLWGWKEDVYDAAKHSEYAQDMLEAKFVNVYFSVVFFYQVFKIWIRDSLDYLIKELETMNKQAEIKALQDFWNITDGNTVQNL